MIQPIASLRASTVRRRRAPRTARRGALVVAVIFFLLIGVLLGSLVLNWAHLIVVQRTLQGRADAIALAAAPALIDSGALTGWPLDTAADFSTAAIVADQYREANNDGGAASLRVAAADLHLSAGHLLNKLGQPDAANFIAAAPYDLL
ncbi:MAG TPA: hypothetical protein VFE24_17910, partial [Pirellulales bacterium]|nr:hypothetical protein [Pirellulales bacterium]